MFRFEEYSFPEEAGVSSAGLLSFMKGTGELASSFRFHSVILLRHGKVVFRMNPAPYDDVTPHVLFSLSKSFTSAAAGFAVSEGLIRWDSSVVDILPEEIPEGCEDELRCVTLETLLSMGSGLDPASDSPSPSEDVTWARHVLSHKLLWEPMTHFHYNTFGTYLVSCMIQKVTGQTVRDYLMPRLFDPLEIPKPDWDLSPQGVCCGGFGLHLSSDSIARFGQCLLQHGIWEGRRILPEGWVELATAEHIANYDGIPEYGNEWAQGYGFQFWRCMEGRYRGDGAFGQICMVDEAKDAVLAATCGSNDMGAEYKLLRDTLWPAFDAPAASAEEQRELKIKLATLAYSYPTDDGSDRPLPEGEFATEFQGQKNTFSLYKDNGSDRIVLTMRFGDFETLEMRFPRTVPDEVHCLTYMGFVQHYIGAYGWKDGRLYITAYCPQCPDTMDGYFEWDEKHLYFHGLGVDIPGGDVTFERVE